MTREEALREITTNNAKYHKKRNISIGIDY